MLEDATPVQQIYENEIAAMTPADDANVPSFSSVKSGLPPPERGSASQLTDTTRCEPGRDLDRNNRRAEFHVCGRW